MGGWVHRRRDLGGIVFLDLRDRDGIVQVAVGPGWASPDTLARAQALGGEAVVLVEGEVVARPADMKNAELATGEVEVHATAVQVVGPAETPAIPVARSKMEELPAEELRLRYRHLDLRRPELQANLILRRESTRRRRKRRAAPISSPIATRCCCARRGRSAPAASRSRAASSLPEARARSRGLAWRCSTASSI